MPQSGEAPIQGIRYLATSTNHPPPTNQNRRTKTPPTRPASPPSRYKIGTTSIEGPLTEKSHQPPPPKTIKGDQPKARETLRPPHSLPRTEWRTVPGRRPNQDSKPTSLAPAVLFGSRFSSEEKWDRKKGKNPQRKQEEGVVKETEREPRLRISQENSLLSKRSKLTNQKTHEDTTKAVAVYRLQRLLYWKSRLVCVLLFLKRLAQTLVIG